MFWNLLEVASALVGLALLIWGGFSLPFIAVLPDNIMISDPFTAFLVALGGLTLGGVSAVIDFFVIRPRRRAEIARQNARLIRPGSRHPSRTRNG